MVAKTKELKKRHGVCQERIVTSVLEAISCASGSPFSATPNSVTDVSAHTHTPAAFGRRLLSAAISRHRPSGSRASMGASRLTSLAWLFDLASISGVLLSASLAAASALDTINSWSAACVGQTEKVVSFTPCQKEVVGFDASLSENPWSLSPSRRAQTV